MSPRCAATSRPPRWRRCPTRSCPTSSGCTTSASAPTCTTAGRPALPPKGPPVLRTHDAGTLRASDAGSTVTLAGWVARRRDHGGVVFVDLRDASGYVQVVVREEEAHALRNEFCVLVTGEVRRRPEGNENPELPTGEIEVAAAELRVLSAAAPLPFPIETDVAAGDEVRYKYRYLDLRRQGPAKAIRLRSEVNRLARGVMARHGFTEVETPTLTASTPQGAR